MAARSRPKVLTTADAASELGITDARIRQLILSGRLNAVRLGSSWTIDRADLDDFLARQRRPGRPKRPRTDSTTAPTRPARRSALILTAIPPEYEAVMEQLRATGTSTDRHGNVYTHAIFGEGRNVWNIAILQAGPGNDMAAVLTTHGIHHVAPDLVMLIGVAGGLKDVALGDVVVGTRVYGYESGKEGRQFHPRPEGFRSASRLIQIARHVASRKQWLSRTDTAKEARAFVGPIAAGEKIAASKRGPIYKFIRTQFSDAVAIETEGRGFLAASELAETRAVVIRGVSDLISGKAKADAKGNQLKAARNATAFALEILAQLDWDHDGGRGIRVEPDPRLPPPCRHALTLVVQIDVALANRLVSSLAFPSGGARAGVLELVSSPPPWLDAAPAPAWAVVGYFAQAYQAGNAASAAFQRVAKLGGPFPSRWLAKAALAAGLDRDQALQDRLLREAEQIGAGDVFVASVKAAVIDDTATLLRLTDRSGLDIEETLLLDAYLATAKWRSGDQSGALELFGSLAKRYPERASPLLQEARFLISRVIANISLDRVSDLERIRNLAIDARDRLRSWGGDSSEAVSIACQAALSAAQEDEVLKLALEPPVGEATAEEARSPEVLRAASQAALIARRHDLVATLSAKMPRTFSGAIFEAILLKRKYGKTDTVVSAFQDALTMANDASDQFTALYQLADLGVWPLPAAMNKLAVSDPERADVVMARSEVVRGEYQAAKTRLRRWSPTSPQASEALASTYVDSGDVLSGVEIWVNVAERFNMPHLLVDAMDAATQAGMGKEAEDLATKALARLPGSATAARAHVLGRLVELAGRRGDWGALQERAIALRRESDSPSARWALIGALVNQGKRQEAWEVITESPKLVALDEAHGRLLVGLQSEFDPGQESVQAILEILERFPDSELLWGIGLGSIYTMQATDPLSPSLQSHLNQITEAFFNRYPDSKVLRRITFATVEESLSKMRGILEPGFDELRDMARQVSIGQLPYGAFASMRHRSYALALASRDVGCIVARLPNPTFDEASLRAAVDSLDKSVVADTSALIVSAAIKGSWQLLLGAFHRILVTDSAVRDAIWAERDASAKSTLSIGLDPNTREARPYSVPEEDSQKVRDQITELAKRMRSLEQVACQSLPLFPGIEEIERHLPWLSPLQVAGENRLALWSDDAAARGLAQQLGISAFGTYDLALALAQSSRLNEAELREWKRSLLNGLIVDLPLDRDLIVEVAREHAWLPSPVSVAISRAGIWSDHASAFTLFESIFRSVFVEAPAQLPHWLQVSILGGAQRLASGVTELAGLLLALSINSTEFDPAAVPELVTAAADAAHQFNAGDPLATAVERIQATAQETIGMAGAAQFVSTVFSKLPEERRGIVCEILFGQSGR